MSIENNNWPPVAELAGLMAHFELRGHAGHQAQEPERLPAYAPDYENDRNLPDYGPNIDGDADLDEPDYEF